MPSPSDPVGQSSPRLRDTALASGLVTAGQIDACEERLARRLGSASAVDGRQWDTEVAALLVRQGVLSLFQARSLLDGRWKLTLGQYEIIERLGRGGMGEVFRARHALMGRMVAIKVLPRSKSTPESEAAFQREIRMLARLDHENLVHALDAGHDGKVYYLVTELIPGLDLRRQIRPETDGPPQPLDEAAAASVISQAARGLSYAHGQGLVHRDIKPSNLLVTPDGRVKVLDLGLAGSVLEEESARLGRVVGTMDFMAPEQIRSPDTVGPQADIYALGCTLYFAVTGQVPFPGGTRHDKAKRQLSEQPRPVRELRRGVDERFCRVIEAMMCKQPQERLQSAQEVIEALRPWCPERPVPMRRELSATSAKIAGATVASPGSLSAIGSSLGAGSADASLDASQATRGMGSAADDTVRSTGSAVDLRGSGRKQPSGTEASRLTAGSGPGSMLSSARRRLSFAVRIVAVSAAIAVFFAAATRKVFGIDPLTTDSLFGSRGVTLLAWGIFWLTLAWQAVVLPQRGLPPADGASRKP